MGEEGGKGILGAPFILEKSTTRRSFFDSLNFFYRTPSRKFNYFARVFPPSPSPPFLSLPAGEIFPINRSIFKRDCLPVARIERDWNIVLGKCPTENKPNLLVPDRSSFYY